MAYTIELHPLANAELQEAYDWYENRSPHLGSRLIHAVGKRLEQLEIHPERFPARYKNYRQVRTAIFPYIIIYEIIEAEQVVFVSAIFHAKRNPAFKYRER